MQRPAIPILAHARCEFGVLTLVVCGALLATAPAHGAPLAEIDTGLNTRFELAGERVLMWAAEEGTLTVREPDGALRVIYRARKFRDQQSLIDRVSVLGGQLAVLTEGWDAVGEGGKDWSSLRTGPFDGPYGVVEGREGANTVAGPIAAALAPAGLLLALNDRSNHRALELRPADGSAPVRLGEGAEQVVVNARYAATRTNERAAAYDLDTRTRIARVAADSDPGASAPPVGISASGTLVYTDRAQRLWSYVPATRAKKKLLDHVPKVVRVVGERAYVVQRRPTSPFEQLDRLVALDLAGGPPQPLTAALTDTEFFTDGARLLYAEPGPCVYYGDLPAAAPERAPVGRCTRQNLRFDVTERHRRPRVRMWVTCPGGSADRCTGTAKLTAEGRRLGRWRFSVAGGTGATHVLKVKLRRAKRRQVARLRITGSPTRPITRRIVFLR
jgi:hypothetical protein